MSVTHAEKIVINVRITLLAHSAPRALSARKTEDVGNPVSVTNGKKVENASHATLLARPVMVPTLTTALPVEHQLATLMENAGSRVK